MDKRDHDAMLNELENLHKQFGIITIHITHDMNEAKRLADRMVVIRDGKIQQVSSISDIELNPSNKFVAQFTKTVNTMFIDGLRLIRDEDKVYAVNAAGHRYELAQKTVDRIIEPDNYIDKDIDVILGISSDNTYLFDGQTELTLLNTMEVNTDASN
jgi:ABC-type sugar transport system ATPase subunit